MYGLGHSNKWAAPWFCAAVSTVSFALTRHTTSSSGRKYTSFLKQVTQLWAVSLSWGKHLESLTSRWQCGIGFNTMDKRRSYSDCCNCSLLLLLFLTRFWFSCACNFVVSKKSKDCIYSHLSKRRISPDLVSMFEGEESFHVQCRWGNGRK